MMATKTRHYIDLKWVKNRRYLPNILLAKSLRIYCHKSRIVYLQNQWEKLPDLSSESKNVSEKNVGWSSSNEIENNEKKKSIQILKE